MRKFTAIICCLVLANIFALAQNRKIELVVQTGHSGRIYAAEFAPDGKTIASTSDDKTIKIWDASSGQELRTLSAVNHSAPKIAYAPDSQTLASVSALDKTLKIWSLGTGRELKSIETGHAAYILSIAFSPDGTAIATSSQDKTIKLWNPATGQLLKTLTGHTENVEHISFAADGKTLLSTADDETIRFWNIESGQETKKISVLNRINSEHTTGSAFSKPSFSADGKYFTAGGEHGFKIWSVETGEEVLDVPVADSELGVGFLGGLNPIFSPSGQFLVIGGFERKFKILDLNTRQVKVLDNPDNSKLYGFSPNGREILIGNIGFLSDGKKTGNDPGGTLRTFNVETLRESLTLARRSGTAKEIAFSPDGNILASSEFATNLIRLWDFRPGRKELRVLAGQNETVRQIVFSPDGKLLAGNSSQQVTWDQIVRIWDVETGNLVRTLPAVDGVYGTLAFSPDGNILAHVTMPNREPQISLWNVETGQLLRTIKTGQTQAIWDFAFAFSPDGKTMASGSLDGTIKLWETATGRELQTLGKLYDGSISRLIFSHDGKTLAAGYNTSEHPVKLWNVQTGGEIKKLPTAADPNILAFSPDDRTILTASYSRLLKRWDDKIRLWNVASGVETQNYNHDEPATKQKILSTVPDFYLKSEIEPITADKKLQATETDNGRLTLTEVASNRELLSLVALGSEDWLTTAPNGLFDGTPAAWKQIIWRFDGNTFTYAPVEAFFKEFYRPGLLAEILSGNVPPAPSIDITRIDIRQPNVKITEIGGQILNTEKNPLISQRTVTVKVEVADNFAKPRLNNFPASSGANDLRLFRNGSLVKLWERDLFALGEKDGCRQFPASANAARRAVCQIDLPIIAGENQFAAYVFNHQNVKSNDAVFRVTGADSLKREGILYVLAIGVNEYAVNANNLAFAVADVETVGKEIAANQTKLLQKQFAKTEVITLTDRLATKANILLALEKFAAGDKLQMPSDVSAEARTELAKINPTAPEDGLVIYYAGHGTASKNNFYLIPHDGFPAEKFVNEKSRLEKLYASSVSDEDLQNVLQKIDAGKMLMVIDACNSGQALESAEKRRGPMNSKGLAQLAFEKGMYILTAAQSRQAALEVSKLGHGLLTFALLEGLTKSKKTANGDVTERKWFDYATAQVPQLQVEAMQTRSAENKKLPSIKKRSELAVAAGDNTKLPPEKRGLQVPRIFYRRELESNPMIVAR